MTSKLYVLTLLAVRENVSGTRVSGEAGASTVLTVQTSYEAAEAEGWNDVHKKYPQEEEWFDHQVTVFELPESIDIDEYHVAFHITRNEA